MKKNILIADAGGTSTTWCIIKEEGEVERYKSLGFSPVHHNKEDLSERLKEIAIDTNSIGSVYFYGAGIGSDFYKKKVIEALSLNFPEAKIEAYSDLLAAAHATAGNEKGMTCILGTGSNVAFYDGKTLKQTQASLGYILGDEGSGAHLGKTLINSYFYNELSEELKQKLEENYPSNIDEVLENVYKKANANKYLASYARFLQENRGNVQIEKILEDCFNAFFEKQLLHYSEAKDYPVHYIGSVAFIFKDVLENLHKKYRIILGRVLQDPLENLIAFYKNKNLHL